MSASLAVNDGAGNICTCPLCRAQDAKDAFQPGRRPNLSDRFFRFYNEVMRRVLEKNPSARIGVLAYGPCAEPPKEVKVHRRIMVFKVQPNTEALRAWKAVGATPNIYMWLWDGGFLTIRPSPRFIAELIRECHKLGGIGFYSEILPHWVISAPKFYVLARLLWNTELNEDEVLDEYFRLAYGEKCAPHIRAFFDKWYEIYDRRPAELRYQTVWGWRRAEQLEYLKRGDFRAMDSAIEKALRAEATPEQKKRLQYLVDYYQLLKINGEQYLLSKELSDPEWIAEKEDQEILDIIRSSTSLTAKFNRLWQEKIAGDRSGWLLDERYCKNPQAYWDRFLAQLRMGVSSGYETAVSRCLRLLSQRKLGKMTRADVIEYWTERLKEHPTLAPYIAPEVNRLKGVKTRNIVPNAGFERGEPGSPPALEGWDFYEFYGTVKGTKAVYAWEPASGHSGRYAIALGEGRYPEMKSIIKMEKGRRYLLSFWYKTVGRDKPAQFLIFSYDGELSSPRDIQAEKISRFIRIDLKPTDGLWRRMTRVITTPRGGTFVIALASYYQKKGWWVWFDDIEIKRIW